MNRLGLVAAAAALAAQREAERMCERIGHDDEPIRPYAVRCMRCGRIA